MATTRSAVWVVTKYDGTEKKWERELKGRDFTRIQMSYVIRMLACTDLTSEEAIDSIDPSGMTNHLNWSEEGGVISCGDNPHYVARQIP